jgi:Spy/CpxP family protein refolding chaperone
MSGIQSVSVNAAQSYASVGAQSQQSLAPFANLDLTAAQRTQLRSIFTAAKQNGTSSSGVQAQVAAVLTPAQQQNLSSDIRSRHHHHHGAGPLTSPSATPASAAATSTSVGATDALTVASANNG